MDCDNGGCHLSPSQFRFNFRIFQWRESAVNFYIKKRYCNKKMLVNLLILSLLLNESGATGLQRAGALINEPLNSHKQINDIILTGITDQLEEAAYRLQVL